MAYVPPHLRRRQEAVAKGEKGSDDLKIITQEAPKLLPPTISAIQNHFWPTWKRIENDPEDVDFPGGHNVESPTENSQVVQAEDVDELNGSGDIILKHVEDGTSGKGYLRNHRTLNGTEAEPDKLRYVLLFKDAHPRWSSDKIIYVKSDLHLLPTMPDNSSTLTGAELNTPCLTGIQVFEQSPLGDTYSVHTTRFDFAGYYSLSNFEVLEPHSPELQRMLEQKWTRTNKHGRIRQVQRDAASWKRSLNHRWAVLKFEKDEKMARDLGPPQIAEFPSPVGRLDRERRLDENMPPNRSKSVNEMLRDLRLKDNKEVEDHGRTLESGQV